MASGWNVAQRIVVSLLLVTLSACATPDRLEDPEASGEDAAAYATGSPSQESSSPETATYPVPTTSVPSSPAALNPADSDAPASSICAEAQGPYGIFMFDEFGSDPRCLIVTADQQLKVVNKTKKSVQVDLGPQVSARLRPGREMVLGPRFGDYLARGVHFLEESAFEGDPEIWFK
jgi:hypothetical protein